MEKRLSYKPVHARTDMTQTENLADGQKLEKALECEDVVDPHRAREIGECHYLIAGSNLMIHTFSFALQPPKMLNARTLLHPIPNQMSTNPGLIHASRNKDAYPQGRILSR